MVTMGLRMVCTVQRMTRKVAKIDIMVIKIIILYGHTFIWHNNQDCAQDCLDCYLCCKDGFFDSQKRYQVDYESQNECKKISEILK